MKIVWTDGYARESVAERLVADGIKNKEEGEVMLEALRARYSEASQWYKLVEDNYRLGRGMADFA